MILEFADIKQASSAAAAHIMDIARSAVKDRGFCTIVLAGGSTPRLTYELLAGSAAAEQAMWRHCHFFWGDERWVAASHPDSNFSLASRVFLTKLNIPAENIHRIPTAEENPEAGAAMYERHLRDFFCAGQGREKERCGGDFPMPRFDMVLLGMGEDGHTASLFPGSRILAERERWVAAVPEGIGSPPAPRITLTLPLLNRARNVLFLIAGKRKRKVLNTILTLHEEAEALYPAARVKPAGSLVWLVAEKG